MSPVALGDNSTQVSVMKKAMVGIAILMKEKDGELKEKLKESAINNLTRTELKDTFTFLAQKLILLVM